MKHSLFSNTVRAKDIGLLIIRLGVGLIFIKHGWTKLQAGEQTWLWLGSNMQLIGITFMPLYWGMLAACTEFCGGISLVLGLFTRLGSFFLSCVMLMATLVHYTKADSFTVLSHPLSLFFVFAGLAAAGAGKYSLDHTFFAQK